MFDPALQAINGYKTGGDTKSHARETAYHGGFDSCPFNQMNSTLQRLHNTDIIYPLLIANQQGQKAADCTHPCSGEEHDVKIPLVDKIQTQTWRYSHGANCA
ncbi:hypothetical protein D3C77_659290 [compost metagenome]